ncbi:hypothetical protein Tco_0740957, partial [Tanacetum coccineum]
ACLLPTPKGKSSGNYARCVNQILQNLNNMQVVGVTDSWELWISFCLLCEHHNQLPSMFCTSFWKTVHSIPAKSSPSAANQTDIVAQRRLVTEIFFNLRCKKNKEVAKIYDQMQRATMKSNVVNYVLLISAYGIEGKKKHLLLLKKF